MGLPLSTQIKHVLAVGLVYLGLAVQPGDAQPIPDISLNTQVDTRRRFIDITGGQQVGSNLFHSFRSFDVPTDRVVQFLPDSSVSAIFGRVTGNSVSSIEGTISVDSNADLYLLNPNGFEFGSRARLQLNGGDLTLTTADSIRFADGKTFAASSPSLPLLSISTPINLDSLLMNGVSANSRIINNGTLINRGGGLSFTAGQIGGRGTLRSEDHRLQLMTQGDVQQQFLSAGTIAVNAQGNVSIARITAQQSMTLTAGGTTDINTINTVARTGSSGSVTISSGGDLNIGSAINTQSQAPSGNAGDVTLRSDGNLNPGTIRAYAADATQGNGGDVRLFAGETLTMNEQAIATYNGKDGLGGNSGNISLNAQNVRLGGTRLQASSLGNGAGGNITLQAQDAIQISSSPNNLTRILTNSNANTTGDAGEILLQANQIDLIDGVFDTRMAGSGRAGSVTLQGRDRISIGASRSNSTIQTTLTGQGRAGNILLDTQDLQIQQGTRLLTQTTGIGDAGKLTIQAAQIQISDNSRLSTTSRQTAQGNSGYLEINAERLTLDTGASLNSSSEGSGNAGEIRLNATKTLTLTGPLVNDNSPADAAQIMANASGSGQAGRVNIQTPNLLLSNRAKVQATANGAGAIAGQIDITAQQIQLNNRVRLSADARNASTSDGGAIRIRADRITASGNSDITALSSAGVLGAISIQTNALINLQQRQGLSGDNDIVGQTSLTPLSMALPVDPLDLPIPLEPTPLDPNSLAPNPPDFTPDDAPAIKDDSPARPNANLPPSPVSQPPAQPINPSLQAPGTKPTWVDIVAMAPADLQPSMLSIEQNPAAVTASEPSHRQQNQTKALELNPLKLGALQSQNQAPLERPTCQDNSAFYISGRGGVADAARSVLAGRSLWRDARSPERSQTFQPPALASSDAPAAHRFPLQRPVPSLKTWQQEASAWQFNQQHQPVLMAARSIPVTRNPCLKQRHP